MKNMCEKYIVETCHMGDLVRNAGGEAHLSGSNIKDGNNVVQKRVAKDEAPLGSAIDNARQAEARVGINIILVDHVLGTNVEGRSTDGDAKLRRCRVAGYEVRTLIVDVDSRRGVGCKYR
jgi:hypothetical protein